LLKIEAGGAPGREPGRRTGKTIVETTISQHLQRLPGVDRVLSLLRRDSFFDTVPLSIQKTAIRTVLEQLRKEVRNGADLDYDGRLPIGFIQRVKHVAAAAAAPRLVSVVNATGVVIHTNLGRSLLPAEALHNIHAIGGGYSNLEFNLRAGKRGSRYSAVEEIICEISGAEAAMVVNNNAGAVLLCLSTIAEGKNVVVSRGELVEIGGAFRIPDVMAKSGAVLKEVGTTNRTHPSDYENAIDAQTGLLLKVHASNYRVVGFTADVPLKALVTLGRKNSLPVMEDLGSGTFVDFSKYGLVSEPTVQASVSAGADIVTFSGDKLLGGPQAGIVVGSKHVVNEIKRNPLTRALRIDKLTLAALESTLRLYRDERTALEAIPTLKMLTLPKATIASRARQLNERLHALGDDRLHALVCETTSRAGGGSLPTLELPSTAVRLRLTHLSVGRLERLLRAAAPPVVGRIEADAVMLDLRTVGDGEIESVVSAVAAILQNA